MKAEFMTPAIMLVMLASPLLAGSVTLTPEEDTDIYQFTTRPTSSSYSLGVNISDSTGHSQRSLIRFPVTPAAARATADTLASATLRLYVLEDDATRSDYGGNLIPGSISFFTQGASWSLSSVRWSSGSPTDHIADVEVTMASTASKPVWVEADVTASVKSWLSGSANNGFLIQGTDETAARQVNILFASMETGFPPELVITTEKEPPPPPPEVNDHIRPKVKIIRSVPKKVTTKMLRIRGKTTGSDRIKKVCYRIGNGPTQTATGTKTWKFKIKLAKGKNVIRIFAMDATGDTSKLLKLKVRRLPKKK
jgi:hypothetical protein